MGYIWHGGLLLEYIWLWEKFYSIRVEFLGGWRACVVDNGASRGGMCLSLFSFRKVGLKHEGRLERLVMYATTA